MPKVCFWYSRKAPCTRRYLSLEHHPPNIVFLTPAQIHMLPTLIIIAQMVIASVYGTLLPWRHFVQHIGFSSSAYWYFKSWIIICHFFFLIINMLSGLFFLRSTKSNRCSREQFIKTLLFLIIWQFLHLFLSTKQPFVLIWRFYFPPFIYFSLASTNIK